MLVEAVSGLALLEAVVVGLLAWYTRRQIARVKELEAAGAYQEGVRAQMEAALANQQVRHTQEAKADETIAKTASATATDAARLLNSLTARPGS